MPFDPSLPAAGSPLQSQIIRDQLNGLNDKIDAVPAGPPGAAGQGFNFRGVWDGTASYMPYDVATHAGAAFLSVAVVSPTSTEPQDDVRWVVFAQRGSDGTQGGQGLPGADGAPGEVTTAALDAAIAGTSASTNAVATLDTPLADPDAEAPGKSRSTSCAAPFKNAASPFASVAGGDAGAPSGVITEK